MPDPAREPITNALPVDAALGLADFYEVVGFADHRASAEVWYRLLDCGMRLAAAGGTDAMANFASLRGPVGVNRTYVAVDGPADTPQARRAAWLDGLRAGRTLATNGPLLGLTVQGSPPGAELGIPGRATLRYEGYLRSIVPVGNLELVVNGEVARRIAVEGDGTRADFSGDLDVDNDAWVLLRAWNADASPLVFDLYPYATTNPVFVDVAGRSRGCGASAAATAPRRTRTTTRTRSAARCSSTSTPRVPCSRRAASPPSR